MNACAMNQINTKPNRTSSPQKPNVISFDSL